MMCWRLRRTISGFQTLHDVSHLDCGQYADTPACGKSPQRFGAGFFGVTARRSPSFDGDPGEDRHGDLLAISCPAQARYSTSVAIAARNAASSPLPKRDRDHDGAAPLAGSDRERKFAGRLRPIAPARRQRHARQKCRR